MDALWELCSAAFMLAEPKMFWIDQAMRARIAIEGSFDLECGGDPTIRSGTADALRMRSDVATTSIEAFSVWFELCCEAYGLAASLDRILGFLDAERAG